jgi:predicted PurR-regulated permease PerM
MQNNRALQTLIVLLVIIAAIYLAGLVWSFMAQFSSVILLFFLSWLLAFVLRPLARMLSSRGLSYGLSVLMVYLALGLILVLMGFLLVPVVTQQVSQLISNFDSYVTQGQQMATDAQNLLLSWGVRAVDIEKFYGDLAGQIQSIGLGVLNNVFSVLQSIATLALQLVLVFILSFYFMKDGDRIFGSMLHLLPPRWQDEGKLLAISIEKSFGAFVRGQLLFAVIYAFLTGGVMLGFGLDYIVIASIVAGFAMIIPLVGNFIAFVPPVLACLVTPGKADEWPWVLFALFVVQGIQMNMIGPRIMSQAIGIHPLYVMAAMLIGGQVAGFWGALFGIPVAGTINLVGRPLMRRIRYQSPLYKETQAAYLTTRSFATGPLRASTVEQYERARVAGPSMATVVDETTEVVGEVEKEPVEVTAASVKTVEPVPVAGAAAARPVAMDYDYELDFEPTPRVPTFSERVWHFTWVLLARAYSWVGSRARIRASRR